MIELMHWINVNERCPPEGKEVLVRIVPGRDGAPFRISKSRWYEPRPGQPTGRGTIDFGADRALADPMMMLERVTHWAEPEDGFP
jgi:hypothetical protein